MSQRFLQLGVIVEDGYVYKGIFGKGVRLGPLAGAHVSGTRRARLAVSRSLLHQWIVVVDRALARLAGGSLLTFSVDGSSVSAHRLVTRVIREQLQTLKGRGLV